MDFSIGYSVKILEHEMFPSKPREYKNIEQQSNGGSNSFSALLERESDTYLSHIFSFAASQGCCGIKDFDLKITIKRSDVQRKVERDIPIKRNQYKNGIGLWSLNIYLQDVIRSMIFELIVGSK